MSYSHLRCEFKKNFELVYYIPIKFRVHFSTLNHTNQFRESTPLNIINFYMCTLSLSLITHMCGWDLRVVYRVWSKQIFTYTCIYTYIYTHIYKFRVPHMVRKGMWSTCGRCFHANRNCMAQWEYTWFDTTPSHDYHMNKFASPVGAHPPLSYLYFGAGFLSNTFILALSTLFL